MEAQRPISSVLLAGLYDQESYLNQLRGCPHILRKIWRLVQDYWKDMIKLPVELKPKSRSYIFEELDFDETESCLHLTEIDYDEYGAEYPSFPEPQDININMMPFIVGETFEDCKLPENLRPYWPIIQLCLLPELSRAFCHIWPKSSYPSELGRILFQLSVSFNNSFIFNFSKN